MEINLQDIIKQRIEEFERNPQNYLKVKGKERNKEYNNAVKCFQDRVNVDRKKAKQKDLPFMAIKMKLAGIKEVDDLRAWYKKCLDYSYTRDPKTLKRKSFSQAFFGGLKCK